MLIEKKPAICGICPGGCAVEVTLESGRLVKVEPRRGSRKSCVRGGYAPEIVYSPHRLKAPLIRTGERGGKFREASWDEALTWRCKNARDKENTAPGHVKPPGGAPLNSPW